MSRATVREADAKLRQQCAGAIRQEQKKDRFASSRTMSGLMLTFIHSRKLSNTTIVAIQKGLVGLIAVTTTKELTILTRQAAPRELRLQAEALIDLGPM